MELISLQGCAGWSAQFLFANPKDRFVFFASRPILHMNRTVYFLIFDTNSGCVFCFIY